jgi:hypothetical protein
MDYTTNEEDQRKAARLQARLRETSDDPSPTSDHSDLHRIPNVTIADGAHKYVLISAILPGGNERQNFVCSKRGASYHMNCAEPMVEALERSGYSSINVSGGGRIFLDEDNKKISIFGYSYGFGLVSSDCIIEKALVCCWGCLLLQVSTQRSVCHLSRRIMRSANL